MAKHGKRKRGNQNQIRKKASAGGSDLKGAALKEASLKEVSLREEPVKEAPIREISIKEQSGDKDQERQTGSEVQTEIKSTGQFGLGHKKTKRAAVWYVLEDIGEALVRAKNWCVKNYRTSIPAGICIVLVVVVACILVRNIRIDRISRAEGLPADVSVDEGERSIKDLALEENAHEYVNQFVTKYYEACAAGDIDTYCAMRDATDEDERIIMQKKADYIENYQIVNCLTKPGPKEKSYLAYVYYEVKFNGIETTAPGVGALYLCTNDTGELFIYSGEVDQEAEEYMKAVNQQEDVMDLFTKADVTYKDVVTANEDLRVFLEEELRENLNRDIAAARAELNIGIVPAALDAGDEPADPVEPEPEPEPEPQTETVATTKRVNVRSSSSVEATRLGTVDPGTRFTRYESLENGWSRIGYEGGEAYIKSEYLQVVETTIGTVKTNATVNIRASASQTATKLGTVNAGTSLELVERQENGWSRILYNGMTAYVKSEFIE